MAQEKKKHTVKIPKYKLIYWDNVLYFVYLKDARRLRDSLPYYQQEDSIILRIKK